jgi:hypothetical protein
MIKLWRVSLLAASLTMSTRAADEKTAPTSGTGPPADFKLVIALYGAGKEPIARSELVVRGGVAYQFITESPEEVLIIDPLRSVVYLLDLERQLQTDVTATRLDNAVARLHRKLSDSIQRLEKAGNRADRVSAAISLALIDPQFTETFDPTAGRLRLTNRSVEVEALGEPEDDQARLAMVVNCLAAITKLAALRAPESLPPFASLDTLRALASVRRLRPTEISYLYRLAGPPRRIRWTYRLVTTLTDREREAISRVDRMRSTARSVPYERYEEVQ